MADACSQKGGGARTIQNHVLGLRFTFLYVKFGLKREGCAPQHLPLNPPPVLGFY